MKCEEKMSWRASNITNAHLDSPLPLLVKPQQTGEPKTTDAGGTTPSIGRHLRIFSRLLESKACAGQKLCFALEEKTFHRHPPLDWTGDPEACEGELKG